MHFAIMCHTEIHVSESIALGSIRFRVRTEERMNIAQSYVQEDVVKSSTRLLKNSGVSKKNWGRTGVPRFDIEDL